MTIYIILEVSFDGEYFYKSVYDVYQNFDIMKKELEELNSSKDERTSYEYEEHEMK